MANKKSTLLSMIGLMMLESPVSFAQAPEKPLIIGQVSLSFYAASAAVVKAVLLRLGHPLTSIEANHPDIYKRLAKGEVDILVASWLPNAHGKLQEPLADQLVEAATLYEGAKLYWSVPAYVPIEEVRTIDDLKKPEVAARMDKDIVGVGPGSGLMNSSQDVMESYGLKMSGYTLRVAPATEWTAKLADAFTEKKWMVMPLWQPQYLNAVYPLRVLEDPKHIFGVDRAVVVVRKETWEQLPLRTQTVLGRVHLGIPTATELERRMVVDHMSAEKVAQDWMKANPEVIEAWFKP